MGVVGVSGDKLQEGYTMVLIQTSSYLKYLFFFFNFLKLSFLYLIFYKNTSSVWWWLHHSSS